MIQYQGISQYEKDLMKRKMLENTLLTLRLKANIPGPAGLAIRNEISNIRKQLSKLPSKNDTVYFNIIKSQPFSNKPYRSSSSWITNCIYNPRSNTVSLRFGTKSYLYNISLPIFKSLLKYRSIGQYYNIHLKGTM